ncbi:DUF5336 domain-containing protein [Streptomyces pacificus]|uniref:Uncharacterized protein n=1 Tax=Streptomyces pacificus TaxID=2705029 RepID=A0A6A0API5_9ACTN|nr:DUF5336 domain-containing protein [Streptomyces pacificus]GFH34395.1 hypothetical protein SCWH03_06090 [Streptomyces pacificus]
MNIRSLTRGDGVVIGAAVVLFIASFLDFLSADCPSGTDCTVPNAWDSLGTVMSVYLGGIIAAGLVVAGRAMPGRKVVGMDVAQFGAALSLFALWTILWTVVGIAGSAGAGAVLGLLGALLLAAGAVAAPLVPALKAPLIGAPRPQAAQPYGAQQQGGYGYPGAQQQHYGQQGPHGRQQPFGGGQSPQGGGPAQEFSPFWFAVPVARPLYPEDGSPAPIAELAPGTWYLAVDQRGPALVAQTQDGRRGVLQDTTGIQRG